MPTYKFYRAAVIPLALEYYGRIDEAALRKITRKLRGILQFSSCKRDRTRIGANAMQLFNSRLEYLKYYRNEAVTYSNLSEGCSTHLYYV